METASTRIPRLKAGQGFGGPEYYGCCNTGQRPIIRRINLQRINGTVEPIYIVGPQYEADTLLDTQNGRQAVLNRRRHYGKGRDRVWIYRTRSLAVKKFLELCEVVSRWNAEQRAG